MQEVWVEMNSTPIKFYKLWKKHKKACLIACNDNNFDDNVVCDGSYQNMFEDEEDVALVSNPDDNPEIILETNKQSTAHSTTSVKQRRLIMGRHSRKL